jgi:AraC-like DNA-binding protein
MANSDIAIDKTGMITGEVWLDGPTRRLQQCTVQVLVALRSQITPTGWRLDLLSPFWRLYQVDAPGAFIECGKQRHELAPGHLHLVPAWVRFTTATKRAMAQDFIHFHVHGFPITLLRSAFPRPLSSPLSPSLRRLAEEWRGTLAQAGLDAYWLRHLRAGALAQAAFAEALEALSENARSPFRGWLAAEPAVQPAVTLIETRLAAPPSNAELARACGLGPDHFIRRFRECTGLTPGQYGLERRVLSAAGMLAESRRKIDDIAEATGFGDRFHFSRIFTRRLAISPAAYRRMHQREHSHAYHADSA